MADAPQGRPATKRTMPRREAGVAAAPLAARVLAFGRCARARLALLLAFVAATVFALLQAPRPYAEVQAGAPTALEWLAYPIERNPQLRLPALSVDLKDVFFLKDGRSAWIVGDNGYIAVTTDGGLTWQRRPITAPPTAQAAAAHRWWPDLIGEARAAADPAAQKSPPRPAPSVPLEAGAKANVDARASLAVQAPLPAANAPSEPIYKQGPPPPPEATQSAPITPPQPVDPRSASLEAIAFADAMRGAAVGMFGAILSTADGGRTWQPVASGTQAWLQAVAFADSGLGVAVGDQGTLLVTRDGGRSWQPRASGTQLWLESVRLLDARRGVAVGRDGVILATGDGGDTWQVRASGTQAALSAVAFTDARRGVAVGVGGTLLATEDGGQTWQARDSGTQSWLWSVHFADAQNGIAVGDNGAAVTTDDGGRSWQAAASGTSATLNAVHLADARSGIAVGEAGTLLTTADAGRTWQARASGPRAWLDAVHFADARHGVAVGHSGAVLATEDGGRSWQARPSGTGAWLTAVRFADPQHAVAVGNAASLASKDGGQTWQSRPGAPAAWLAAVAFADPRRGVAVGSTGAADSNRAAIFATADGGQTWQTRAVDVPARLNAVTFADAANAVVVGESGAILVSRDGGSTWQGGATDPRLRLNAVAFPDARSGVAVGADGAILVTRDAGATWQTRSGGAWHHLRAVHFADARHGVAVGLGGVILATADGGDTWQARQSGTEEWLSAVHFGDAQHGAIVGYGVQLHTEDGGQTWSAARYGRWPAPWYWLSCAGLLALIGPAGRLRERAMRSEAPPRTVADEYVSDRPARSAAEDRLGFAPRVDGLSRYLRNLKTEPPLTLAITGPWGSGKSSFMRQLQEDLERHGARTVWFNAWHHQKEEQLHAALLDAVRRQAVPPLLSRAGLIFRLQLFWERTRASAVTALVGVAIVSAASSYLFMKPAGGAPTHGQRLARAVSCIIDPPPGRSEADKLAAAVDRLGATAERLAQPAASVPAATPQATALPPPNDRAAECRDMLGSRPPEGWFAGAWRYLSHGDVGPGLLVLLAGLLPLLRGFGALRAFGVDPAVLKATLTGLGSRRALSQQTGFRQQFAQEFGNVGEALRPAVLSIFIDDLDRCNEQQVMEVLEAVNYLVESGRCFVVLGIVEETVQRLVGLAFERVAAELAEQEPHDAGDGAKADERKREQRQRFAERYLEKLINLRIEVPALDPARAAQLMASDAEAEGARKIVLPPWVGWVDRPLAWACRAWLVAVLLAAAGGAWWLGGKLAQGDQPAERAEATTSPGATAPGVTPAAPTAAPPPGAQSQAEQNLQPGSAPEQLAPTEPERAWWQALLHGAPGLILLAALLAALTRRPEYHTHDSPAFVKAFEVWSPLVLAKVKTPRGLKRFQNRVRFLAMALDAQASPAPRMPEAAGPLGKWLATRELARTEAAHRFNTLLPEPILVALAAVQQIDPQALETSAASASGGEPPTLATLLGENTEFSLAAQQAIQRHEKMVSSRTWPDDCAWPPDDTMLRRFQSALGLLPVNAQAAPAAEAPAAPA